MDSKGVYAIARSVWDDTDFVNQKFTQREAWMWLIGAAVWEQRTMNIDGKRITLERGEFCFAVRFLAIKWKWSKSTVSRFLLALEKRLTIRDTSRNGLCVYSINKYNDFQVVGLPRGTANGTQDGTAVGQPWDKEKTLQTLEEKKLSKEAPSAPPSKPVVVSKLPSWLPLDAWSAYLEMRRKMHKAPTPHAVDLLLTKLDRWRSKGHDPTEILNYSTMNSYVGLFEPRAEKNGQRQSKTATGHDKFFSAAASIVGDFLDDGRAGEGDGGAAIGATGRPLLPP